MYSKAAYKDINHGVKFEFLPGVSLYPKGETITARMHGTDLYFETTDYTGICEDISWFNPKNVVLELNYDDDTLLITKKSSGQKITLKIDPFFKSDADAKKMYNKYLTVKKRNLKKQADFGKADAHARVAFLIRLAVRLDALRDKDEELTAMSRQLYRVIDELNCE